MAWTDEMVEELKKLWDEGVTTGEIGRRLGISKNSIVGKVHRLGLSGRPSPIKKKSDKPQEQSEKKVSKPKKAPVAKTTKSPKKEDIVPIITPSAPKPEIITESKKEPKPEVKQTNKPTPVITPSEEEDIKLAKTLNIPSNEPAKKGNLSLTELDNHTCRWPIGDPKDDNFHFCGKKVRLGQTYCEEHSAIAYVKPGKK